MVPAAFAIAILTGLFVRLVIEAAAVFKVPSALSTAMPCVAVPLYEVIELPEIKISPLD